MASGFSLDFNFSERYKSKYFHSIRLKNYLIIRESIVLNLYVQSEDGCCYF